MWGRRIYPEEPGGEPEMPRRKTWRVPETPARDQLVGRKALVLGYGLQGRPTALNLRDSGCEVTIGGRLGGATLKQAEADGFPVRDAASGVPEEIEAVFVLLPDTIQPELLRGHVCPTMRAGRLLIFAHGYTLVNGEVPMPEGVDVVVLAPHGPGKQLRERYEEGSGLPAQLALYRDPSGEAFQKALLWGSGLGYDQGGMRTCTVAEEVYLDLYVEQMLLCGGLVELTLATFDAAVDAGFDPEQVMKSTSFEVGNTAALLAEHGPTGLYKRISEIALKGSLLNGPTAAGGDAQERATKILAQIQEGGFVRGIELEPIQAQIRRRMAAIKSHQLSELYRRRDKDTD